ncbi:MAG: Gldg family protein [Planctomycetaceae bacterium]|nr:Gldg family protein [Planctomycetaceae bacterium]
MRRFLALVRKEASGIFMSPAILFTTAFFILINSFAFYLTMVRSGTRLAVFDEVALFMLFTSILLFPLVSMRAFSEDNVSGTLETLLTAPVSHIDAVLAKFSACVIYVLVYLVHGLVYAVLLSYGGNLDWNTALAALLALFAFGCLAMALGVFVSALTAYPVAAAAGSGGALLFLALAADLDPYSGTLADIFHTASFVPHAKRWIGGQLDSRGLVYFVSGTILFLFYAWLAVRSRQPEKRYRNPVVRRRLTATYLLVALGAVLMLAQAAVLHIHGFWESGTPIGPTLTRLPWRWLTPLILALGALFWSVFTYRAARRAARSHRTGTKRYATITDTQVMKAPRYYYEANLKARRRVTLAAFAALVLVINVNWLAHYPFRTFLDAGNLGFLAHLQERSCDVSRDHRNSLSPTTLRALDALQGRAQIYSFLPENLQVHDVPVAQEMRRLLARYADYNPLVSVNFADAEHEPELAKRLSDELGVPDESLADAVIVEYGGRRLAVRSETLAVDPDWRRRMPGDQAWVFDGENRITQALLHLIDPRIPTVFFTYGHMEHGMAAGVFPGRSVSTLTRVLAGANMRVRQHSFLQAPAIPPECDMLVVASPRLPFYESEVAQIRDYLARGGRLLVLAPPAGPESGMADQPFNHFLFQAGGSFRDDMVEDPDNHDGAPLYVLGRNRRGDGGMRLVFPFSRSIRDNPRAFENGWTVERMVDSHPESTATDLEIGIERNGPFTLVFRSSRPTEAGEARVVAIASGRLATDADIHRGDNEEMLLGMVQWLAGREESSDIRPREWVDRHIRLTGAQLRAVLWIGVVALPLAWLLAGVSAWWIRRE